jgi:hypothetical protein
VSFTSDSYDNHVATFNLSRPKLNLTSLNYQPSLLHFANGRDLYVDLSVVSTLCGSYRNIGAKQAGAAGVARRNEKLRKYSEQMEMVAFEHLVVESIGGWNLEGKKLLKKIAARVAMFWRKKLY